MNVLLFAPYSDIWLHSFLERSVANTLISKGCHVTWISCHGCLAPGCLVFDHRASGSSLNETTDRICRACRSSSNILRKVSGADFVGLEDYLQNYEKSEIEETVRSLADDELFDFVYQGVKVGRYCTYDLVLKHKLSRRSDLSTYSMEWRNLLRQCMLSTLVCQKLIEERSFDVFLVHNNVYAVNRSVFETAHGAGVSARALHSGPDFRKTSSSIVVFSDYKDHYGISRSLAWSEASGFPLSRKEVDSVRKNSEFLMRGKSPMIYSSPLKRVPESRLKRIRDLSKDKRIVLCLMSSTDEIFASRVSGAFDQQQLYGPESIFKSSEDWLSEVIRFCEESESLHLFIRPHPREFSENRSRASSKSIDRYYEIQRMGSESVSICWPSEQIPLYLLANQARVVLNHTSTAGIELALMGLPVIVHDPKALFSYPIEVNISPKTKDEYWSSLIAALDSSLDFEKIILAFRYRSFLFERYAIDLSDVIKNRNNWTLQRVVTGLRDQKNFEYLSPIVNLTRKIEVKRYSEPCQENRILNSITSGSSLNVGITEMNNFSVEFEEIQRSLIYFAKILGDFDLSKSTHATRIRSQIG